MAMPQYDQIQVLTISMVKVIQKILYKLYSWLVLFPIYMVLSDVTHL